MPKHTRIIAIAQQKGGTGKTTTTAAIGAGMADKGKRVLLIDLDAQSNLTFALNALNPAGMTAADMLSGAATAESAIIPGKPCDLIPATDALAILELTGDQWQYRLARALEPIKNRYDIIVIDTPPALGKILACTLTAATEVIIPCNADFYSLQGVRQLCNTIRQARSINPALKITGILITKYDRRKIISKETAALLEQTARENRTKVFTTKIRECIALAEAVAMQTDIFTYARNSTGAQDYTALITELSH